MFRQEENQMQQFERKSLIFQVIDIEEMIYSPKFGLKGMVDASLLVKFDNLGLSEQRILPLEFKSGKLTTGQASITVNTSLLVA
jgi:DNA replication ATP-dependent helicase Dna2